MAQRKPLNGGETSCRRETSFTEYKQKFGVTNDLPENVRMEKLTMLFKNLARVARHYSENLQPGELQQRIGYHNGVPSSLHDMVVIEEAGRRAVDLMKDCLMEMGDMPCAKRNGTSVVFAECSKIYSEESQHMKTGSKELAGFLRNKSTKDSCKPESALH